MKRWTTILSLLVVLILGGLASLPVFVNANTFRPAIEKQLTTALGRTVKLGNLNLSLFSGSLVANDLSVADDPRFSAMPFLVAKRIVIGVSLRQLIFSRQVNIHTFEIVSPEITVIRATNGTWNFSSIGQLTTISDDDPVATSKHIALELTDLPIGRIVIENGRAVITGLAGRGHGIVYERVNLTARDFSFASQFPFELKASLPASGTISVMGHIGPINRGDAASTAADVQISVKHLDPIAVGFLDPAAGLSLFADLQMHTVSDGQIVITNGSLHIQNLKLRKGATSALSDFELTYTGTHHLKQNNGLIDDATLRIGYTAIHASGTYQLIPLDAKDPVVNLKLAGQNLPIDELQPLMTAANIRLPNGSVLKGGRLSMTLGIVGHTKSPLITGSIALDDTRLIGFDIGSKIHGIAALSGMKTGDETDFEKLRMNVRITNVSVVLDKIDVIIPVMGELTGSGSISPADQLDFNLLAKVHSAKGVGKIGVALITKLNGASKAHATGVPLHVTGTPDDPYITADTSGIARKKIKSITSIFDKKK